MVVKPSTYSWLVNPKLFREIVKTQALHQSVEVHDRSGPGSVKQGISCNKLTLAAHGYNFVHPLEEDSPFTEAEVGSRISGAPHKSACSSCADAWYSASKPMDPKHCFACPRPTNALPVCEARRAQACCRGCLEKGEVCGSGGWKEAAGDEPFFQLESWERLRDEFASGLPSPLVLVYFPSGLEDDVYVAVLSERSAEDHL